MVIRRPDKVMKGLGMRALWSWINVQDGEAVGFFVMPDAETYRQWDTAAPFPDPEVRFELHEVDDIPVIRSLILVGEDQPWAADTYWNIGDDQLRTEEALEHIAAGRTVALVAVDPEQDRTRAVEFAFDEAALAQIGQILSRAGDKPKPLAPAFNEAKQQVMEKVDQGQ